MCYFRSFRSSKGRVILWAFVRYDIAGIIQPIIIANFSRSSFVWKFSLVFVKLINLNVNQSPQRISQAPFVWNFSLVSVKLINLNVNQSPQRISHGSSDALPPLSNISTLYLHFFLITHRASFKSINIQM